MLMVGTVLGPGTIFLMIVGAWSVAFNVDNWRSFWINLVPIVLFVIICLTTKAKFQVSSFLWLNYSCQITIITLENCIKSSDLGGSIVECHLFDCHDGRLGRNHFTIVGRRFRFTFWYFSNFHGHDLHRGGHFASARVLVSADRTDLLSDRALHVSVADRLFGLQFEQRFVGNARSAAKEKSGNRIKSAHGRR